MLLLPDLVTPNKCCLRLDILVGHCRRRSCSGKSILYSVGQHVNGPQRPNCEFTRSSSNLSRLLCLTLWHQAAGACLFVCCMGGWYLLFALLLPTVDFPVQLPVGDLSHLIPGASERKSEREDNAKA